MERRIHAATRTPDGCELRIVEYPPGLVQGPHAHGTGSITIVLRGELIERIGATEVQASALSVVAKPAGLEHANSFGPDGATTLQIVLAEPGPSLGISAAPSQATARWEHAGPACRPMLKLVEWVGRAKPRAPGGGVADLVREAMETLAAPAPAGGPVPSWLCEIRAALANEPSPVMALARRAGVHPVYLARRFREHFGLAPSRFRAQMRLRRAASALTGDHQSLALVALDAGYCDQPHMSHELRSATGMTPRALRRLALAMGAGHR
jgi:AraC family transcriptional regulator